MTASEHSLLALLHLLMVQMSSAMKLLQINLLQLLLLNMVRGVNCPFTAFFINLVSLRAQNLADEELKQRAFH